MSKRIMGSVIYISLEGFEPDLDSNGYYLDEQWPVFELVCLQQKGKLATVFPTARNGSQMAGSIYTRWQQSL